MSIFILMKANMFKDIVKLILSFNNLVENLG